MSINTFLDLFSWIRERKEGSPFHNTFGFHVLRREPAWEGYGDIYDTLRNNPGEDMALLIEAIDTLLSAAGITPPAPVPHPGYDGILVPYQIGWEARPVSEHQMLVPFSFPALPNAPNLLLLDNLGAMLATIEHRAWTGEWRYISADAAGNKNGGAFNNHLFEPQIDMRILCHLLKMLLQANGAITPPRAECGGYYHLWRAWMDHVKLGGHEVKPVIDTSGATDTMRVDVVPSTMIYTPPSVYDALAQQVKDLRADVDRLLQQTQVG